MKKSSSPLDFEKITIYNNLHNMNQSKSIDEDMGLSLMVCREGRHG